MIFFLHKRTYTQHTCIQDREPGMHSMNHTHLIVLKTVSLLWNVFFFFSLQNKMQFNATHLKVFGFFFLPNDQQGKEKARKQLFEMKAYAFSMRFCLRCSYSPKTSIEWY